MNPDLPRRWANTFLAAWWLVWSIIIGYAVFVLWLGDAQAVSLQISGHSTGRGIQNLTFVGDLLNVTISQNATFQNWSISVEALA